MSEIVLPRPVTLTPRQREVVLALADGLDYPRIGARLGVAKNTVCGHVNNLAMELRTRRPQGVIGALVRLGLMAPAPTAPVVLGAEQWELVELFAGGYTISEIAQVQDRNRDRVAADVKLLRARLSAVTPAQIVWRAASCGVRQVGTR